MDDSRKVKVLNGIEHLQMYPHMYIGDTETPNHLLTEVIDNALDEVLNGYGSELSVKINKRDHVVCISDNGSGLPLHKMEYEGENNWSVYFLCTRLFSGTKFTDKVYAKKVGQHGIGLVAVNALSDWMTVTTADKEFRFEKSEFVDVKTLDEPIKGAKICFKPSKKYFKTLEFNDTHYHRLMWVKALFPDAKLIYNDKVIQDVNLENFVRDMLSVPESIPMFKIEVPRTRIDEGQMMNASILFTYDISPDAQLSPNMIGIVNLRQSEGSYFNSVVNGIATGLLSKITNTVLTKEDLKIRLRLFVDLRVNKPHFDSQNKTRYVGPSITKSVDKIAASVRKLVDENEFLKMAVDQINQYRIMKRANTKMKKARNGTKISTDSPLRDCSRHPGKRLYIVEGASAGNTLTRARDPKTEAVLPMQGKIINAEVQNIEKVLNNKFIRYLLEAIGVKKIGDKFTPRYDEFAILADPDPDGLSIALLVTLVFYKLLPELIQQGKLIVVKPPLYGYMKNKKFKPVYTVDEVKKLTSEGVKLFRFKGLGEMTASQLKEVIRTGHIYKVTWSAEGAERIRKLFSSSEAKRQLLSIPHSEIESVLFS